MARLLMISIFLWTSVSSLSGQDKFGIKAGINRSTLNFEGKDYAYSFYAGAYADYMWGKTFFFQPELLYSKQGARLYDALIDDYKFKFTFDYLALPALLGLRAGKNISILFGPEFDYLVGAKIALSDRATRGTRPYPKGEIKATVGFNIRAGELLNIDFRYCYGFKEQIDLTITDANGFPLFYIKGGKNRVLQLGLTYSFPLKKAATE